MAPYRNMTFLQPPSKGDSIVALIIDPTVNPSPIPMAAIPLASPSCRPGNHMPAALCTLVGIFIPRRPNRNIVAARLIKLLDSPTRATASPVRRQRALRVRFTPKRSPNKPPSKTTNIPARGNIPQTIPSWTKLNPKSSDISLKRTGRAIQGMAMAKVWVSVARVSTYHL
jgi:hypothetical protein